MKKLLCKIFGHKYKIDIYFSHISQKLKCTRCDKKFGIHHEVKTLLPWDGQLEEMAHICYPEKFKPDATKV